MSELQLVLATIFAILTQLLKISDPEKFETTYKKYVIYALVVVGVIISVLYFLAYDIPVVVRNQWEFVLIVLKTIINGIIAGLSATGIYELGKQLPVTNLYFKSTSKLLSESKDESNG